jgi:adenylate cyclase
MTDKQIKHKDRQLELLMSLDRIRDTVDLGRTPHSMFSAIASLLKRFFLADASAILLVHDETNEVEALSAISVPEDMALTLCREAMHLHHPFPLKASVWTHSLAVRIAVDSTGIIVGGFFIARDGIPFTAEDSELLTLAESQIDSAVMQARIMWKLAERNRELEAIFQIDHIRDSSPDEKGVLNSFCAVILKQFEATFCLIFTEGEDNRDIIMRGSILSDSLPQLILNRLRVKLMDVQSPQPIISPPELEQYALLGAPLRVSGKSVGSIIIARNKAYSHADSRLLFAMMSQIDSAVVKHRISRQLEQRNRELESIYRIDHIRDQDSELETMLQAVLDELCSAVFCEMGYIMLYNDHEESLELIASIPPDSHVTDQYVEKVKQFSEQALKTEDVIYDNGVEDEDIVRSIVAVPLILNTNIIGVFGAVNSINEYGFTKDNRRMLTAITSQVDTAVFERLERRRMRKVLSRSVDPKVLEALLQRADDSVLAGERVVLTVLFGDLRGSTEWAERTEPDEFVETLNRFLEEMTNIIFKHGGTLDKFVGDEVIALFGSPVPMEDHAYHAAKAALEMQDVQQKLIEELAKDGKELPVMGVGISSGEVIAGEFGPAIRTDFTAMGRVMNLGSRLCSEAKGKQVIISSVTYEMLNGRFEVNKLDPVQPKGIIQPVQIYQLLGEK